MNKNIIIGSVLIALLVVGGVFALTNNNNKINTEVEFLSNSNLSNGDHVEILLKDVKGNPLPEQNITIMYEEQGNTQDYHVITDSEGKAYLALTDEPSGAHTVTIKYDGNEKYNPCTSNETIIINEKVSENKTTTTTKSTATASTVKYNNKTTSTAKTNSNNKYNSKNNNNTYKNNKTKYDPEKAFTTLLYYDSKLGVYYDDFGNIHGGPYDGQDITDLRAK